jgi:inosose dehydratase
MIQLILLVLILIPMSALAEVTSTMIEPSRIVVQLYVFGEPAQKVAEPLAGVLSSAHKAGFENVQGWLSYYNSLEDGTKLSAMLEHEQLKMPCAYAGGAMHTLEGAEKAIDTILAQARIAAKHGLKVVVHNPDPLPREKSDEELNTQVANLNRLGAGLADLGIQLAIHQHDPEMRSEAREWYYILKHTDPQKVFFCLDLHWVFRGKQDPYRLLEDAGNRVVDLHLRNSKEGVWAEDFGSGDIDYSRVKTILDRIQYKGFYTVELAYDPGTKITRSLEENLRRSYEFVSRGFPPSRE